MRRSLMFGKQNYFSLRALQISTVFTASIVVQQAFLFPRAGWIGFAVMMIYAGFDNGTTILRANHRFWGMLLGLLSGYLLWFIGHVDYRLLLLIIPLTLYCAHFLAGQAYSVPTVFTVNTSIIGSGYFDTSTDFFPLTYFLTDYLACTVIAFALILFFEYFWFSRYQLIHLFIRDRQIEMVRKLYYLSHLLNQTKLHRSDWFNACISYTESLYETKRLAQNTQFLRRAKGSLGEEFNQFLILNSRLFVDLKALYIAREYKDEDYLNLLHQVQSDLLDLKALIRSTNKLRSSGELHVIPS